MTPTSKNIPMRTNDIHADHSEEQEQPQSNVQKRPLRWAVSRSQRGESAEAAVKRKVTKIIPGPKTIIENTVKQILGYHFL